MTMSENATAAVAPDLEQFAYAGRVLAGAGVRLMNIEGELVIGLWSDLDSAEIRQALKLFGSGNQPVRYLDGHDVPPRYKVRRIEGDPVPMNVLAEMERHPEAPWEIRDRMLKEMKYHSRPIPWSASDASPHTLVPVDSQSGDEREMFWDRQRRIARAWTLWLRWRRKYPTQAERYRQAHQEETGDLNWLLDFVSLAAPRDADQRKGRGVR